MANYNSLLINPWVPSQISNVLGDLDLETQSLINECLQMQVFDPFLTSNPYTISIQI